MKLAFATTTPEVDVQVPVALYSGTFAERLTKAAAAGYDGVELMVARPSDLDASALLMQVADAGLEIAAIASGAVYMVDRLTLLSESVAISAAAESRLAELIELAAKVCAPLVTVGGFRGRLSWAGGPDARKRLVAQLIAACDRAASEGVRLVVEPLNRYESDIINNTDHALALCEEVDSRQLGLLLDTYHVNIEEPSVTACFEAGIAAGRLWHVHLGDSNRLPPGQGHLDFPAIVETLRRLGYRDYLSAELLPRPDADSAGEATIRYMRQLIPGQRTQEAV